MTPQSTTKTTTPTTSSTRLIVLRLLLIDNSQHSLFVMKVIILFPILLTVIHGTFSIFLLAVSHLMPMGGLGGAIGHFTALFAFMINLPGILTLNQFYASSPSDGLLQMWIGSIGMILITDVYLFSSLTLLVWAIAKALKHPIQAKKLTTN